MFFFPFATDAPLYHWPIVTVLMIVINALVFFATGHGADPHLARKWILHFDHIRPLEWVTNNFMHADILHLLGNMLFLWPFGLITEGKLGWWRFLIVYLGIGTAYGACMQISMRLIGTNSPGALGASAVLFGLLALCIVWAPKNEFKVFYLFFFGYLTRWGVWEMSVMAFGGLFVGWEAICFVVAQFRVSSAGLHLMGFAVGFPLGILMLKMGWVDCEGWDLLAVWSGKLHTVPDKLEMQEKAAEIHRRADEHEIEEIRAARPAALELIASNLEQGNFFVAYTIYRKHAGPDGAWPLPDAVLSALVSGLVKDKLWPECIALLRGVISQSPAQAVAARLKLAHLLIQAEQRPRQALAVLGKLPADLPGPQAERRDQLKTLADRAIEAGELEVAVDDW